jgi:hypothetical protein
MEIKKERPKIRPKGRISEAQVVINTRRRILSMP